ncbi:MAG: hypothetical protein P4L62_03980 [Candidatus Pacebacteria bacterium]|nr:hypothetical protein [Candidatus Paceibacterota bacterium]
MSNSKLDEFRKELAGFCQTMRMKIEAVQKEDDRERQKTMIKKIIKEISDVGVDLTRRSFETGVPHTSKEIDDFLQYSEEQKKFQQELKIVMDGLYKMVSAITLNNLAQAADDLQKLMEGYKGFEKYIKSLFKIP